LDHLVVERQRYYDWSLVSSAPLREQPGDGLKIQPNGPRFNFVN
jgi:hypothetical protein